jgi:hypothetical protein
MPRYIDEESLTTRWTLMGSLDGEKYFMIEDNETKKRIGALIKGQKYYVRVDAFNESGITEGKTVKLSTVNTF